jgi:hypothetical protein
MRKGPKSGTQFLARERLGTASNAPRQLFSGLFVLGEDLRNQHSLKSLALLVHYRFCELSFNLAAQGRFDCDFQP